MTTTMTTIRMIEEKKKRRKGEEGSTRATICRRLGMRNYLSHRIIFVVSVLWVQFVVASCGANDEMLKSGRESPNPASVESPKSTIDDEINNMRTADFRFIWVIRRKDGGVFDQNDKAVLRANTVEMNRRVLADDQKAIIIGSNSAPFRENFDALTKMFAVLDVSPEPMPSPLPTREPVSKSPKVNLPINVEKK